MPKRELYISPPEVVTVTDGGSRMVHVEMAAVTRKQVYYLCPCCWVTRWGARAYTKKGERKLNGRPAVHMHGNSGDVNKVGDTTIRMVHCVVTDTPTTVVMYVTENTEFTDTDFLSREQIVAIQRSAWLVPADVKLLGGGAAVYT